MDKPTRQPARLESATICKGRHAGPTDACARRTVKVSSQLSRPTLPLHRNRMRMSAHPATLLDEQSCPIHISPLALEARTPLVSTTRINTARLARHRQKGARAWNLACQNPCTGKPRGGEQANAPPGASRSRPARQHSSRSHNFFSPPAVGYTQGTTAQRNKWRQRIPRAAQIPAEKVSDLCSATGTQLSCPARLASAGCRAGGCACPNSPRLGASGRSSSLKTSQNLLPKCPHRLKSTLSKVAGIRGPHCGAPPILPEAPAW